MPPKTEYLPHSTLQGTERKLAYINHPAPEAKSAGLVWLNGFNSVMTGTKASELAKWAAASNRSMLRFDYSGHGQSDGDYCEGTITQWLDDTVTVLEKLASGPQILVGSSMGGWIVLLLLRAIAENHPVAARLPDIAGAVLIAPAWDMTELLMWNNFSEQARADFERDGYYDRRSQYDGEPYRITKSLIEDGRKHLIGEIKFTPPCPVRVLQGVKDPDVPWQHANKLTRILQGENIMLLLVHDGDHRLSRPNDIARLIGIIDELYQSIEDGRRGGRS